MKPIWVVDDDHSIRFVLEKALARENLPVRVFSNSRDVLAALVDDAPQVLVSDIRMPGGSGLELLQKVKAQAPNLPVIIMTAFSDLDSAVSAFQGGAFEYLAKPFDVEKAVELIRRALEESLREESVEERNAEVPEMLGHAPAMQDVFRGIGRLSQSHVTVLITGESGSGKELVARALHKHSPRANGPFVAINTAAIPKDLLESELFGHERGAFTGAQTMRRGRFEQAEGGTLFLDEIGDMPFDLQTRLLRVLSDGHFYRVGGHSPLKANVRVIAATHQMLEQRVKDGLFREDLFHRINVIRLRLPPLRERREDIAVLARFFLQRSAKELGVDTKRISEAALESLGAYSFPGNVRELENLCHWLTVMAPAQVIEPKDLPVELIESTQAASKTSLRTAALAPALQATDTARDLGGAIGASVTAGAQVSVPTSTSLSLPQANLQTGSQVALQAASQSAALDAAYSWEAGLDAEARRLLKGNEPELMDRLMARFEATMIRAALDVTRGRRIEAAQRLGIGRNTISRKIQDLGIDAD